MVNKPNKRKGVLLTNLVMPAISSKAIRSAFTNATVGVKLNKPLDVDMTLSPLFCLPSRARLRLLAIRVTDSEYFTNFMVLVILTNCITMSLQRPDSDTNPNAVDNVIHLIDPLVLSIFVLEMILKVVAQGLVLQKHTYLRDGWNSLDCTIVLCALLQVAAGDGIWAYTRALRPLRLLNKIDGLKFLVRTLWNSLSLLRDVLLLLLFLMCAFAIFGMHLWSDKMYQRCFAMVPVYLNGTQQLYPTDGFIPAEWLRNGTMFPRNITMNGTFRVLVTNDTRPCDQSGLGRSCTAGAIRWPQECGINAKPNHPVFNFDHFGNAMLLVLKIISLDDWVDVMKDVMASTGSWAFIYFFACTLFGGYLCLNLIIAVLSNEYSDQETVGAVVSVEKEGADEDKEEKVEDVSLDKVLSPAVVLNTAVLRPILVCALDVKVSGLQSLVTDLRQTRSSTFGSRLSPQFGRTAERTVQALSSDMVVLEREDDDQSRASVPMNTSMEVTSSDEGSLVAPRRNQQGQKSGWMHCGYKPLARVVCSSQANTFVLSATFTNAAILSLDHYGIESKPVLNDFVNYTSLGFTVFFLLDWVLKIVALGPRMYSADVFNLADGVLCIASLPDITGDANDGGSAFTALRAFRLVRALRLARNWESLQALLDTIFMSVKSVSYLCLLFLIVIFIFAMFAFDSFGTDIPDMRTSFATVYESVLTVIVIISGENWTNMMENVMQTNGYMSSLYFVTLNVVGNFVILTLFVAIIIKNCGGRASMVETKQEVTDLPANIPMQTSSSAELGEDVFMKQETLDDRKNVEAAQNTVVDIPQEIREALHLNNDDFDVLKHYDGDFSALRQAESIRALSTDMRNRALNADKDEETLKQMKHVRTIHKSQLFRNMDKAWMRFKRAEFSNKKTINDREKVKLDAVIEAERLKWIGTESDAFCAACSPLNRLRQGIISVVKSKQFDRFILLCIIASSIFLSLDSPSLKGSSVLDTILAFDTAFIVIFFIEMILKIIALGLIRHEGAYLRDHWNILDASVVITSLLSLLFADFKIFRALRVMRLLSRSIAMRLVLSSIIGSVPGMASVVLIGALLFWIFAIVGVSLFKGAFYECSDPSVNELARCIGSFNQTANDLFGNPYKYIDRRVWRSRGSGFDNIGQAMMTLWGLFIKDGWSDVMYNAIDAQGENLGPLRGASPVMALYFISFLVVGGFFLTNLFIGVLVDMYTDTKARGEGSAFMTREQKTWVLAQKVLFRTDLVPPIEPPENSVRKFVFCICFHPLFEAFFTIMITLNCVILAARYQHQSAEAENVFFIINTVLLSLFTVEVIIKLIAFLPGRFFLDNWNIFDLVVVTVSWIGYALGGGGPSVFRLFRIGRLLMLLKTAEGLQTLLNTLIQAIPAFANISFVVVVVYFIFGIVGVNLFARTPRNNFVDGMTNFETVWNALITLYVAGTSESWIELMNAVGDDSNEPIAITYCFVFMFVGLFIMMNLLVIIIVVPFRDASEAAAYSEQLAHFDYLRAKWVDYDPGVSQRLKAESFLKMLAELPKPLWIDEANVARLTKVPLFVVRLHQLKRVHLPINKDSYIRYQDVIAAFALIVLNIRVKDAISASKKCADGVKWDQEHFSIHHYLAAARITQAYKLHFTTRETKNLSRQLKAAKRDAALVWNHEIIPLEKSQKEAMKLTRFLLTEMHSPIYNQKVLQSKHKLHAVPAQSSEFIPFATKDDFSGDSIEGDLVTDENPGSEDPFIVGDDLRHSDANSNKSPHPGNIDNNFWENDSHAMDYGFVRKDEVMPYVCPYQSTTPSDSTPVVSPSLVSHHTSGLPNVKESTKASKSTKVNDPSKNASETWEANEGVMEPDAMEPEALQRQQRDHQREDLYSQIRSDRLQQLEVHLSRISASRSQL